MERLRTSSVWHLAITGGVLFALMAVCDGESARADVTLELVGSGEYAVGQAFPNSPDEVFPITGDSVVIWATLTNVGQEVFEATGPGGAVGSGTGTVSLWNTEVMVSFWDPDANPENGLIWTPLGYWGVQLEPGESLTIAVVELWGISRDTFEPAPVGSYATLYNTRLSFWDGLDRDPNDPTDLPDLFVPLDRSFTVTVIPEPTMAIVLAFAMPLLRPRFSRR